MSVLLNNGDCYEIIPTLQDGSVDLIITDPPYSLGNCMGGGDFISRITKTINGKPLIQ